MPEIWVQSFYWLRRGGAGQTIPPDRRDGPLSRARAHIRKTPQRRPSFRGRLAVHPGDSLSPVYPGYARVYHRRSQNACLQMRQEDRLVAWRLVYTRQAQKDAKKLAAARLEGKAVELLHIP